MTLSTLALLFLAGCGQPGDPHVDDEALRADADDPSEERLDARLDRLESAVARKLDELDEEGVPEDAVLRDALVEVRGRIRSTRRELISEGFTFDDEVPMAIDNLERDVLDILDGQEE